MERKTTKTPPVQAGKKAAKALPVEGSEQHPPQKVRKYVLTKVSHVRAELGRLYADARNGRVDISDASRLGNLLSILHRVIADSGLEERIAAVEAQLGGDPK